LNKNIKRKRLEIKEIEIEMQVLKQKGFDTILILTGDDRKNSPLDYIGDAIKVAKKYFSEILIEVYALTCDEYKYLVDNGLTGVTIYQETYDEKLYDKLHLSGPKKNFDFRLEAPERAIKAGVKEINIGCLLGLNKNFLMDVYLTAIHAEYLQKTYTDTEISISYPRIQPAEAPIKIDTLVDDIDFTRIITATRLFLPRVGLNLSTRERAYMRDNLIGLGITRMSAGSKTTVGGYAFSMEDSGQFEISDIRDLQDIIKVLVSKGYRPEFTNWVRI
jgi:2-iminoacetate synthase